MVELKLERRVGCDHQILHELYRAPLTGILVFRCVEYEGGQRHGGCSNVIISDPALKDERDGLRKKFVRLFTQEKTTNITYIDQKEYSAVNFLGERYMLRKDGLTLTEFSKMRLLG